MTKPHIKKPFIWLAAKLITHLQNSTRFSTSWDCHACAAFHAIFVLALYHVWIVHLKQSLDTNYLITQEKHD